MFGIDLAVGSEGVAAVGAFNNLCSKLFVVKRERLTAGGFQCIFVLAIALSIMKKEFLIIACCGLMFLTACKKDNTTAKASIVGKWYWVKQTYDSYIIEGNVRTSHEEYTTTLDPNSYFEFTGDGVFKEQPQNRPAGYFNYGHYNVVGDSLLTKRDIDTEASRWAIKKLTASALVIHRTSIADGRRGEVEYSMKR